MKIPCPDPCLPAGLTQRDIDRQTGHANADDAKYERELERGDYLRDLEKDRRAEEALPP